MKQIKGRCPSCGNQTLFVDRDGVIYCDWNAQNSSMDRARCEKPQAVHELLNIDEQK